MDFYFSSQFQIFFQLFLAVVLGGIIGLEREYKRKEAGIRTFALVCLGATLFTTVSFESFNLFINQRGISFDPARIIGQIVVGIGFIGAGLIIYRRFHVEGLTTAAGLWVTAAVGIAVGIRLYLIAVFTTFLAMGILIGVRIIEEKWLRTKPGEDEERFKDSNQ